VELHPQKTRVVHVQHGFEFPGYKIKRGKVLKLSSDKIRSTARSGALYAFPREKSINRFMDQVRALTRRRVPHKTKELIERLNPILRGWGNYYKKAHVRKLFNRLNRLDRATDMVAPIQAMAQFRLAMATRSNAVQGLRACQPYSVNTIACIS
jgi:hypothetical protein